MAPMFSATEYDKMYKKTKAERARKYLSGGGVSREDSDDELGFEDHPWKWIFEDDDINHHPRCHDDSAPGESAPRTSSPSDLPTGSKRKASGTNPVKRRINGARMGDFQCHVGDCVLLKAEGTNEAWVGLICDFQDGEEEDDDKVANFMWFSTEKEIRNKQKKRNDLMHNELYITPSWDVNPLASINGKASIVSPKCFLAKYPNGKIPKSSNDYGKVFICRRGCNTRTATYTEEFIWENIYDGSEDDIQGLIERVQSGTKATRKRRAEEDFANNDSAEFIRKLHDLGLPRTPKKKQKTTKVSTPSSKLATRTPQKLNSPTHKRAIVKKPLEFTPLGTRILSPGHILSSPFQIARSRLHVSSVPATLPCRETEFSSVYSHLEAAISDGSGTCIYISGTPGTGKTATVREVVAQLNASVLAEELDDFIFVEINGMKVTDPHQSYSLLWEALKGDRVSPSHALDLLEREFGNPSPRRVPCVVLMDELDQLVTKKQSVMYNFFNWPGLRHSRLIVLAVANTMDLPERTLSNKISSRLGLTRITFPGYTHDQLMKIIQSRLEGVPGRIVDRDAVQFASRKVAAVSGDARRALDICRRAVEIAETENQTDDALPPTPSKKSSNDGFQNNTVERYRSQVTIGTVKRAINEATTSPIQQYLRCLPLSSKLFLAAVMARIRRTGIGESMLGDVFEEAKRIGQLADSVHVHDFLLTEVAKLPQQKTPNKVSKQSKPPRVLSMGAAAMELMEAGIIFLEARKGERTGKVRLNVGEEEIKTALKDDNAMQNLGFST
ncbi:MAG: Origin recognition complex, subunit 1 [Pycnora praestabilis]|nr:MAG: Origin recognition complex, subunit 1 [Pycnora praestabilis]